MGRLHSTLAILPYFLFLFSPAVLAFRVLHESDNSHPPQISLTSGSANDKVREQFSSDYPISDHGEISRPNIAFDPLEELRSALHVMQTTWFKVWIGTWPSAIDWTRAVLDTILISSLNTLGRVTDEPSLYSRYGVDASEVDNEINLYFTQNVSEDQHYYSKSL